MPKHNYTGIDKNGIRFQPFIDLFQFSEGENVMPKDIQLVPVGVWNTTKYGEIAITTADIEEMKRNFDEGVRTNVMVDVNHGYDQYGDAAAGWVHKLECRPDGLWSVDTEWTKLGQELLGNRIYRFMSPEFYPQEYAENENANMKHNNVLIAGSLVNRPLFDKSISPLSANERALTEDHKTFMMIFSSNLLQNSTKSTMPNLTDLVNKDKSSLTQEELSFLKANESQLTEEQLIKFGLRTQDETVTVSASEFSAMQARVKEMEESLKASKEEIRRSNVAQKAEELFFSDKGIKLPADKKSEVVDLMLTFSDEQVEKFSAIVASLPIKELFVTKGSDEDAGQADSDNGILLDKKAKEIMANEKVSYKEAIAIATERNPELTSYVQTVN